MKNIKKERKKERIYNTKNNNITSDNKVYAVQKQIFL